MILFVNRAQPFHLGHLKVVKWILDKHKNRKLCIGIGSSNEKNTKKNPFSSKIREKMIKETLKDNDIPKGRYEIIKIPDLFHEIKWPKSILEKVRVDLVYTRNEWTKRCFENVNVEVREHPYFEGYSGTKIREKIENNENWEKLVPGRVKGFVKKNIS